MTTEASTDAAADQTTTQTTDTTTATSDTDLAAEVAKWQALARKHEDRAKANANAAKELDEVRKAAMTDQDKAVAEAREQARVETLKAVGFRVVDAEVRAAAAGRNVDVDALLEGMDRSRFLTDDGDVDREALSKWVDRITPAVDDGIQKVDLGQGARTTASTGGPGQDFATFMNRQLNR